MRLDVKTAPRLREEDALRACRRGQQQERQRDGSDEADCY
jgi:hypothetical protein